MENQAIGIDLRTTNCCVAAYINGKAVVFENDHGTRTTPSFVAFADQERFFGNGAKNHSSIDPSNTVFDSKRLIGHSFTDDFVLTAITPFPFTVVGEKNRVMIFVEYHKRKESFFPEEISAVLLTEMKRIAEEKLGHTVTKAGITVPAYFNDRQRQATKDSAKIAGLEVLRLFNEPTAAAIAFASEKKNDKKSNVLVYDLRGGTFDVSVLKLEKESIQVKAVNGDTHLGGTDFDIRLVNHFIDEIKKKYNKDLRKSQYKLAILKLRNVCETVKKSLSGRLEANIEIASLFDRIDFKSKITRSMFESLCEDLIRKTIVLVEKALNEAKLKKDDIDEILLVGGSTSIPKFKKVLQEYVNGKTLNKIINPDEAVAVGAAINAVLLAPGKVRLMANLNLQYVTPLSYGIESFGGLIQVIVPRNTPYLTTKEKWLITRQDNQTSVKVKVYQRERQLTKYNEFLGEFILRHLPAGKVGEVKILIAMKIDSNGILILD